MAPSRPCGGVVVSAGRHGHAGGGGGGGHMRAASGTRRGGDDYPAYGQGMGYVAIGCSEVEGLGAEWGGWRAGSTP